MPMPTEIRQAGDAFERFLTALLDESGLATRNQCYTMTEGVLRAFRRRLDTRAALRFADVLPAVLRAIFVSEWDIDEPRKTFGDRAAMTREVQALRRDHNVSPDSAIRDVAQALHGQVDRAAFARVLATLPEGAVDFWSPCINCRKL